MQPWRLLLRRRLVGWFSLIVAAVSALLIATRDWVRPPKVAPRKESEYEGIAFRVPAEWHGSVWDDIGLGVALRADTLEPVSERVAPQDRRHLDVVQVAVRWEDWDRLSAWVHEALASREADDGANGAEAASTLAGLRRFQAPQGTRATDLFLPAEPLRLTAGREMRPELILRTIPSLERTRLQSGEVRLELRKVDAQTENETPRAPYCEFFVPFRHLCMALTFDARHLRRWRELRDAGLAVVNLTVVGGSGSSPR